jgi:hypothetical protein
VSLAVPQIVLTQPAFHGPALYALALGNEITEVGAVVSAKTIDAMPVDVHVRSAAVTR